MPLHLDTITNEPSDKILDHLLRNELHSATDVFADAEKRHILMSYPVTDVQTQREVGAVVFTLKVNDGEKKLEVLDLDLVFKNPTNTTVQFLGKLPPSSEANEYYDADTEFGGRFQLETVDRYLIPEELEGTEREVDLCAFPFRLSVYDTLEELNAALGFAKPVKVGDTDMMVSGYGETFVAPGSLINALNGTPDSTETFSFVIGTVEQIQPCCIHLGGAKCEFMLAQLNTGMGPLTTVISPERYEVGKLAPGKLVSMFADIKADLKLTDRYPESQHEVHSVQKKKSLWQRIKGWFS